MGCMDGRVAIITGAASGQGAHATPLFAREVRQQAVALTPLGRIASTNDVAELVLLLASARSSRMTGAEIAVDGGWAAWPR